jgi:REP element-mobilizing transposase RayT
MKPFFLAQLVESQFRCFIKETMTLFNNTQIVSNAIHTLILCDVNTLPSSLVERKRKTSAMGFISRILIEGEDLSEKTRWKLKALRKLLSSQSENFSIKD